MLKHVAIVSSVAEYSQTVRELVDEWSSPTHGDITLWCRGQRDADYHLIPGEYRGAGIDSVEVFSEFELKVRRMTRDTPRNDWEWYFLMQHHGLKTRLLDWTTGALLALYFAVREEPGEKDAAVWVLDPWSLKRQAQGNPELFACTDKEAAPYSPGVRGVRKTPRWPIAIVPPYCSTRITVQRGAFTIHGRDHRGLDQLGLKRLVRITIDKDAALMVKRELRLAGVSEFTMFPDLDGLARDICAVNVEGC